MRILEVIQEMQAGGAERVVLSIVRGADAQGHAVAVAARSGELDRELSCPRFDLPLVRKRPLAVLGAVEHLWRSIRRWQPSEIGRAHV